MNKVKVYVTADGSFFGASKTDQAFTRKAERTFSGVPCVSIGLWVPTQFQYKPFKNAVKEAAESLNRGNVS